MEGSLNELARYRMERAREMLVAAEGNLGIGQCPGVLKYGRDIFEFIVMSISYN